MHLRMVRRLIRTVPFLLSVDQQFTDAELKQLCKKYELSVVYQYQNFDMFALKTRHPYTDQEMGDLLENLKAERMNLMHSVTQSCTLMTGKR